MQQKSREQENYLAEITRLLSLYRALTLAQLEKLYPELSEEKLAALLRRLEKSGRLLLEQETGMLYRSKECTRNPAVIAAFWVLLDFLPELTYHTVSDFPVTLTFYTQSDCYDVIHVPEEKEMLMNHALPAWKEDSPRRLVIVEQTGQIPLLRFPGIAALLHGNAGRTGAVLPETRSERHLMDKNTLSSRLSRIEEELPKLSNTISAMKITDTGAYGKNYEELSLDAAQRAERIACSLRNLILQQILWQNRF